EASIVIFGHTHERYLMVENNMMLINPGALGDYHRSYAIYENGEVTFYQR
ncbi:MAG: metallophosphoesterase family protein, partial [Firmicutes bacterium]|nr:metallophosphoesterase family protein [Bacillota bacterium]